MAAEKRLIPTPHISELSERIYDASGTDSFLITGGNVIDPFVNGRTNLHDVDVVFESTAEDAEKIIDRLTSHGFVFTDFIPYVIEKNNDVVVTTATKNMTLDIVFVDEKRLAVGPLNSESMYYDPSVDALINDHDCLGAIERGSFACIPSKGFDNENPYIIAARGLAACAKYSVSILNQKQTIFDEFNVHKQTDLTADPFVQYTHNSFPERVLSAIVKAKPWNRVTMIAEVLETEILDGVSDDIKQSLQAILAKKANQLTLTELRTTKELNDMISKGEI